MFLLLWIVSFCVVVYLLFDLGPVVLGRRFAVPSRSPIPSPSQLLGGGAAAVVGQVGLADCSGCRAVGHVLVPIVAPGESVHIDHNGLVNLEASNGSALVTDGQIVPAGLHDDQGRD